MIDTAVELHLDASTLEGRSKDLSDGGVLLFADERLPLRVRLEVDGQEIVRTGRLARAQRMPGGKVAYAIEFDSDGDDAGDGDGPS